VNDALHPSSNEASEAWAARVRADSEQVARFREEPERPDFYAPIVANFKADPRRENDPVLNVLRSLVIPGETWMDIGAGGGRFGLGIALIAAELIAVEPSDGMLAVLRESMSEYAVPNVRIVQSRWPMADGPKTDVSFIANVGNDVEDFGAFINGMEGSAKRLCVAVQPSRPPASFAYPFWPEVHGVERVPLPCLPELLALLLARDRVFEVRLVPRPPMSFEDLDHAHRMLRMQTWVKPGSEKDARLRAAIESKMTERDGRWALNWTPGQIGVVSWAPR
jgi:SAM-dependent methyltransferase